MGALAAIRNNPDLLESPEFLALFGGPGEEEDNTPPPLPVLPALPTLIDLAAQVRASDRLIRQNRGLLNRSILGGSRGGKLQKKTLTGGSGVAGATSLPFSTTSLLGQ